MKVNIISQFPKSYYGIKNVKTQKGAEKSALIGGDTVSFSGGVYLSENSFVKSIKDFVTNRRTKKLQDIGIKDVYAERLAKLPHRQYKNATDLYNLGVYEECIEEAAVLDKKCLERIPELLSHNIRDESLSVIANLDDSKYLRMLDLCDKGIDSEILKLFAVLNDKQLTNALNEIKNGKYPIDAAYMSKLSDDEKKEAENLVTGGIKTEDAANIVSLDVKTRQRCYDLMKKSIPAEESYYIAKLQDKKYKRVDELIKLDVGDINIASFALLSDDDYQLALDLFKQGVMSFYVPEIAEIEGGTTSNCEYEEYREKGYGRSCAYAMSLLSSNELDFLCEMIDKFPHLKKILRDEYDINIVTKQDTQEREIIFTKEIRNENGTVITLFQTYDENGTITKSRREEYFNHSTSSKSAGNSNVYRINYDKYGDIDEMTEFVSEPKNGETTGVIVSKASKILPGVFITKEYTPIDYSYIQKAKPKNKISSVRITSDGCVSYLDNYKQNGCKTNRFYREKKDKKGRIQYSYYSYSIKDENSMPKMKITRLYNKNPNGSVTNVINGVKYKLTFDDKNKKVIIFDGKNTKTLNFKNKLSYYSQNILWENLKQMQADSINSIYNNVEKWNYCKECDSTADGYTKILSSGSMASTYHELGHFEDYALNLVSSNDDFIEVYTREMKNFMQTMPFNEQSFVQYFSPRADLNGANGASEIVAETNLLLNTYGNPNKKLKTRTQFLVRYFPNTIAEAAKLMNKTSNKSILS